MGEIMNYPIILQKELYTCGPACIYMLCEYYHINYNKKKLLSQTKTSMKGTSIWYMQKALRYLGFTSNAVSIINFCLYDYDFPTIALIQPHKNVFHYVIIYNRTGEILTIGDPAYGLNSVSIQDFIINFTGILIIPTYKI